MVPLYCLDECARFDLVETGKIGTEYNSVTAYDTDLSIDQLGQKRIRLCTLAAHLARGRRQTSVVKLARTAFSSFCVNSVRSLLRRPSVGIGCPIRMRIVRPGVTNIAPRG